MNPVIIHDVRISWKAKGLMLLLGVRFHESFRMEDVRRCLMNNRFVIRHCMNKLLKYGYVKKAGMGKLEIPEEYRIG